MNPGRPRASLIAGVLLLAATTGWSPVATPVPTPAQPIFSAKAELVVLHISVTDSHGRYVRGLEKDAFRIFDGGARPIELFSGQDVPATIGVLIDNSGSMLPSRERVVAAALAFSETSHPDDELGLRTSLLLSGKATNTAYRRSSSSSRSTSSRDWAYWCCSAS